MATKKAKTVTLKAMNVALKKLSLGINDVIIIQSDGGVDEQLLTRLKTGFKRAYPQLGNLAIIGISSRDSIMVASDGEVTST